MMPANPRALGRILGFPECCIDRWLEAPERAAVERGTIFVGPRDPRDAPSLLNQIRILAGYDVDDILARAPGMFSAKEYVPCEGCMGQPGWRPWPGKRQRARMVDSRPTRL
jgi:hypothetical protein